MLPVVHGYSSSHIYGDRAGIGPLRMTGNDVSHVIGSDISHVPFPEVCSAHAQPEVDISALVGPFDRKWSWPEVCSAHAPFFFLVVVTWLPDVTEGHLTSFGVPLGVLMRNRKLCNTCSSSKQCWLGVFSTTSASYNHRKPRILYLAW